MFIVLLNYTAPAEEIENHRVAHREWVDARFNEGVFIASGRLTSSTGGVILAHGISIENLEALMATDPFTVNNLIRVEILDVDLRRTTRSLAFLKEDSVTTS